jgi:hypothetical protein
VPAAVNSSREIWEEGSMSTARFNVWVTKVGEPCKIDMAHKWYVHVLHCDGEILDWCNRRYSNIETKCGHVEFEAPPGCYMVCATWSPAPAAITPTSLGNHISHLQIVRANCGDDVCVTLFPPTFHWCGIWWVRALDELVGLGKVNRTQGKAAATAVRALLAELEMDPLTKAMEAIAQPPAKRRSPKS